MSALSYIQGALANHEDNAKWVNAMAALYFYSEATQAYKTAHPAN